MYAGHIDCYGRSAEILAKLLRVTSSTATIFRVCNHYGAQLEEVLAAPSPAREIADQQVMYAALDGSMIFTDNQWREVKLGRVFGSEDIQDDPQRKRGQRIAHSEYTAHLGTSTDFFEKFRITSDKYAFLDERLVFLSDGARWIEQAITRQYPDATQILDFFHAAEYLGSFAELAIINPGERTRWFAQQKALLLAGRIERVIKEISERASGSNQTVQEAAERVTNYYRSNRERMRYDEYIKRGLYIGSGAIESAHRTVIQRRMKLSGQRWGARGAGNMLNLRVCSMSGKWNVLENLIRYPETADQASAL